MLKKVALILTTIIAGAYMIFAMVYFTRESNDSPCKGIAVSIDDNNMDILTVEDIETLLKAKGLTPNEKPIYNISCKNIENAINSSSLIESCECFKTHRDIVGINVKCKVPIMQVFDKDGKEFYIDKKGDIIKGVPTALYLPVASGNIDKEMAGNELREIALFLDREHFWQEQTEQIFFTHNKEAIIVPRVGNHIIEIGRVEELEEKFNKLKKFYDEGLNKIGWNKYSKINIEFKNQVICTKRR